MTEDLREPIRLGMVGGGAGAFIGQVHRLAARLDGVFALTAGALSSRPEIAQQSGRALGLPADRIYTDFLEMAKVEASRPDGIEAVAIVTPNHMHFAPAKAFLEAGIHVICDKPLTAQLDEARQLVQVAERSKARFLLTHTYSGYPLVRHARDLVQQGALGDIRLVQVEYAQDWLAMPADPDNRQAEWRGDPARSGAGGAIADIGTHAYHLARYITGLRLDTLSAQLNSFVPGRKVDDHAQAMLRFKGGALGTLWASQIAVGSENGLKIRVVGEGASIEWQQEDPNKLWFAPFGAPRRLVTRGGATVQGEMPAVRVPSGHPEGYIEAFASLYADFAKQIRNGDSDRNWLPSLSDGLEGMCFIDACIRSSARNGEWTALEGTDRIGT